MSDMTPDQIKAARAAGIITAAQAEALLEKVPTDDAVAGSETIERSLIGDEENLRFIRGFSDIFIAIGLVLFMLGVTALTAIFGGGVLYLGAAALIYLMAEYFGRIKRVHLPTLICAFAFLKFVQNGVSDIIGGTSGVLAALITLGAMLFFYYRIRLPFCMALIAVSLLYLVSTAFYAIAPDFTLSHLGWLFFLAGFITLCCAIMYDMRDQHRTTRFSDNAFWLHLTAAPLIIHGLALAFVVKSTDGFTDFWPVMGIVPGDAVLLLVIIAIIALVGLALNRRALIVSSLGYAFIATGYLFAHSGLSFTVSLTSALILIGALIILLGVGWHATRNKLILILPRVKFIPPPFDPNYTP